MHPELERVERERAVQREPRDLDAWDCVQRAAWHLLQSTSEENAKARTLFERAIGIQDSYSSLLMLGNIALNRFQPHKALHFYSRAKRIDPDDEVLGDNIALTRERIERAERLKRHHRRASWIYWCGLAAGAAAVLGFVMLEIRGAVERKRSRHPA